jgi:hypothetical protein
MKRHLKVIMVVDRDEEEEVAHICPIMCAELLSGDELNMDFSHSLCSELHLRTPLLFAPIVSLQYL